MNQKNSGYSLTHDPVRGTWYVNSWTRLSELSVHSEAATEDFFSYKEAAAALSELENVDSTTL
jgi:hypothetical protein